MEKNILRWLKISFTHNWQLWLGTDRWIYKHTDNSPHVFTHSYGTKMPQVGFFVKLGHVFTCEFVCLSVCCLAGELKLSSRRKYQVDGVSSAFLCLWNCCTEWFNQTAWSLTGSTENLLVDQRWHEFHRDICIEWLLRPVKFKSLTFYPAET